MSQPQGEANTPVPAVSRAVRVLAYLRDSEGGQSTLSAIARATGLPKSSASNLLRTMRHERLVELDEESGRYVLGPTLVEFGVAALGHSRPLVATVPHLRRLAEQSGVTALAMLRMPDRHFLVVEEIEGPTEVKVKIGVGSRFPPDTPMCGRIWQAWGNNDGPRRYRAFTPHTITDPQEVADEVERMRQGGYATSYGEYTPEFNLAGVPVFQRDGRPYLVIALIGTGDSLRGQHLDGVLPSLLEAGRQVTLATGGRLPATYPGAD